MTRNEELYAVLVQLQEAHPTMRFGQLVSSVAFWAKGPVPSATYDVEDAEFLEAAREHLQQMETASGAAEQQTAGATA